MPSHDTENLHSTVLNSRNQREKLGICLVIGHWVLVISSAVSDDWPRWRGPHNNGHVPSGVAVPTSLPLEPKVLWRVKIGEGVGSPVVAGGKVFYHDKQQTKEVVHAVDDATGIEIWNFILDDEHKDAQGIGPRSTPLVDSDRVYVQSARGELQCRNVADGKLLWRKNFPADFAALFFGEIGNPKANGASRHGNVGSPVIEGDRMYVLAGGVDGASIVCLDKNTGDLIWKSQNDQSGYAAAVLVNVGGVKQIIAFTADGVIGVRTDNGGLLWRFPIKTAFARHVTTPVVVNDIVLVASHQHGLFGIKISKDGTGQKAEQAWLTKNAAINFSSPVVVGQHLYGLGPAKNIICVDPSTGKIEWSQEGLLQSSADKAHAAFLVMGNNILTLTDGGQLALFAADPKEFKEISRAQVCGKTWCNPAYANGKLYLRDQKDLLCVQIQ